MCYSGLLFFFFKQKTAYEMRISDWSSDVCSSDLRLHGADIILNSSAATTVEHAEAVDNFTATVGSFATGLNSIITGGDITINAPGAEIGRASCRERVCQYV